MTLTEASTEQLLTELRRRLDGEQEPEPATYRRLTDSELEAVVSKYIGDLAENAKGEGFDTYKNVAEATNLGEVLSELVEVAADLYGTYDEPVGGLDGTLRLIENSDEWERMARYATAVQSFCRDIVKLREEES